MPLAFSEEEKVHSRTLPQFLVFKHIESCELLRIYTLHAQDLDAGS